MSSKYKEIRKEYGEQPEAPSSLLVPTGIPGLDEVIGGGFPEKSVIVFAGSMGTGKTTLSACYIYEGATRYGDKGLYVCLSETKEKFLRNMRGFGWDFERLEKTGKVSVVSLATAREVELQSNLNVIMKEINERKPRRVVIDPLTAMTGAMEATVDARFLTHVLYKFLENANCTAILTAEISMGSGFIGSGVEEFIADGVFVLKRAEDAGRIARELEIVKLRGVEIEEPRHPFTLLGGPRVLYKRALIAPIVELLQDLGLEAESPGYLKGKSGIEHMFDVVALSASGGVTVIDLATSNSVVDESSMVTMFAKVFDTSPTQSILVSIPRLSDAGRRLADFYKIAVIEARDVNEAVEKLKEFS